MTKDKLDEQGSVLATTKEGTEVPELRG